MNDRSKSGVRLRVGQYAIVISMTVVVHESIGVQIVDNVIIAFLTATAQAIKVVRANVRKLRRFIVRLAA